MPATGAFGEFALVGDIKIRNDLRGMADRLLTPEVVLETQFAVLEEAERMLFEAHGGEYVRSGDLLASLTQSGAMGAIRRNHAMGLEFGTNLWYAHFQRKIGGPSGVPRGRRREGPSQVLQLTPMMRRNAAAAVREYIFGPLGARLAQ